MACSMPVAEPRAGLMYPVTGAHMSASVYTRCQLYRSLEGTEVAMAAPLAMIEPRCTS